MSKTKFEAYENGVICTIRRKGRVGCGVAELRPGDKKSRITGETIAYYKAERNYIKDKIRTQKTIINYLNFLEIYLFPYKFYGRKIEWIKERFERIKQKEQNKLEDLNKECAEINIELTEYINQREINKEKIKNFKKRKAENENR